MCDEFNKVFDLLKKDNKEYVDKAKIYLTNRPKTRGDEYYHWKTYDNVFVYRNYDSITEHLGYYRKGERKLDKKIS